MSEVPENTENGGMIDDAKVKPEDVVTPDMVETIVKGANPNWEVEKYQVKLGTKPGDNYMSIMYALGVDVRSTQDDKKQHLDVMVKTMPKNAGRVAMINDAKAFLKETKMYEEILPALVEFQKDRGLYDAEIYTPWPQAYASRESETGIDDYIALQDLRNLNYGMACRREGLGLEDSKLVMRSLGKFHAMSYAKYEGNFDRLKAAYPYLEEMLFRDPALTPEVTKQWLRETFSREAKMLRGESPDDFGPAEALEETFLSDKFWVDMHRLTSSWTEVAVIGHSDSWTNNFLFKYETTSKGQQAVDLKFVDFQLCRVGSRCLDLSYFMYTSLQKNILNEKEDELLAEYFEAFKSFATKLGYFDPKHTLEQLIEEYADYRLFGLCIGLMLAPILTAQSGDIPDLETMPEDNEVMSEESKEMWFGNITKEKATYEKVFNMAKIHIPKIRKYCLKN